MVGDLVSREETTGYLWSFVNFDQMSFEVIQDSFNQESEHTPGSGGQRIITLKALKKTNTPVQLVNKQSWGNEINSQFEFKVI